MVAASTRAWDKRGEVRAVCQWLLRRLRSTELQRVPLELYRLLAPFCLETAFSNDGQQVDVVSALALTQELGTRLGPHRAQEMLQPALKQLFAIALGREWSAGEDAFADGSGGSRAPSPLPGGTASVDASGDDASPSSSMRADVLAALLTWPTVQVMQQVFPAAFFHSVYMAFVHDAVLIAPARPATLASESICKYILSGDTELLQTQSVLRLMNLFKRPNSQLAVETACKVARQLPDDVLQTLLLPNVLCLVGRGLRPLSEQSDKAMHGDIMGGLLLLRELLPRLPLSVCEHVFVEDHSLRQLLVAPPNGSLPEAVMRELVSVVMYLCVHVGMDVSHKPAPRKDGKRSKGKGQAISHTSLLIYSILPYISEFLMGLLQRIRSGSGNRFPYSNMVCKELVYKVFVPICNLLGKTEAYKNILHSDRLAQLMEDYKPAETASPSPSPSASSLTSPQPMPRRSVSAPNNLPVARKASDSDIRSPLAALKKVLSPSKFKKKKKKKDREQGDAQGQGAAGLDAVRSSSTPSNKMFGGNTRSIMPELKGTDPERRTLFSPSSASSASSSSSSKHSCKIDMTPYVNVDSPLLQRREATWKFRAEVKYQVSGHKDAVTSIDTHPTDGLFISSSRDATVRVWSAGMKSGRLECVHTYREHKDSVFEAKLLLSRGSDHVASCEHSGPVHVWDLEYGKRVLMGGALASRVASAAAKVQAKGKSKGKAGGASVGLIGLTTPAKMKAGGGSKKSARESTSMLPATLSTVTAFDAMPHRNALLLGGSIENQGPVMRLWDLNTGRGTVILRHPHVSDSASLRSVCTNGNTHCLVSGFSSGHVFVFDERFGVVRQSFKAHDGAVLRIVPYLNKYIITSGADRSMCLWDVSGSVPQLSSRFVGHPDNVYSLTLHKDDFLCAVGHRIGVGSLSPGTKLCKLTLAGLAGHSKSSTLMSLGMLPAFQWLVSGTENGRILIS